MAKETRSVQQNFLDEDIEPISVLTVHEMNLTEEHLQPFIDDSPRPIGIAPAFSESGSRLVVLAIANQSNVLLVEFYSSRPIRDGRGGKSASPKARDYMGRTLLEDKIFCRPFGDIFAFDFEPIALSLYNDHGGLRLVNGVDIQSACFPKNRQPLASIKLAVGDTVTIYEDNVCDSFENMVYDPKRTTAIALRAWIAQYLPRLDTMEETFANAKRIDTAKLPNVVSLLQWLRH
jgi:regulator of nonsense transcripts 1